MPHSGCFHAVDDVGNQYRCDVFTHLTAQGRVYQLEIKCGATPVNFDRESGALSTFDTKGNSVNLTSADPALAELLGVSPNG